MKRAIILAAGTGKRLGELTKDIPKCLLEIDSKSVLIDFSLEALHENGVKEIVFVSGFASKKLEDHIREKWSNKLIFRFIYNDKFLEFNNVYSAYLARNVWDDETILLNSDIIFHPDILKTLVGNGGHRSLLVIDDKNSLDKEDMKVMLNEEGEIKKISKGLDINSSFGEYIGITYLRGKEREKFLESLCINVKRNRVDIYYEDALADVLNEISVFPCSTEGSPWTEIDTKEDYEIAKQIASKVFETSKGCSV